MFKSKEDLIKENSIDIECMQDGEYKYNQGLKMGVDFAFKSIAERKEFYKKYRGRPVLLSYDRPDIYKKFEKHLSDLASNKHLMPAEPHGSYFDTWLFDNACFEGVE